MLDKLLNDLEVIDQYDVDSGDFIKRQVVSQIRVTVRSRRGIVGKTLVYGEGI